MVLLKAVKPEDLEVLGLVEGLGALDLVGDLKVLDLVEGLKELDLEEDPLDREGLLTLGADEDLELEDDRLLELLLLDLELLLLRTLPSATASTKQDRAKTSVTRAILAMYWYSRVHILLLLSSALVLGR